MNNPPEVEQTEIEGNTQEPVRALSRDDFMDLLDAFRDYLDNRRGELKGPLTAGKDLDTWDPYLIGYSRGMLAGLEMASDLALSYSEWVRRDIYYPDPFRHQK